MVVCRLLTLLLALAALAAVGADAWRAVEQGGWQAKALGQFWFAFAPESLNLVQAIIQRQLHPWLWDPAFVQLLLWPVWGPPGLLALLLHLICRRRG